MDLRLTSNAAVSPKDRNPNGLCRFGRVALLLLGHRALRLCSFARAEALAPRQAAKAAQREPPLFMRWVPERPLDDMRVPLDKAVQIIGMLVEGMTIRGCERLSGVHRDTILRLLETVSRKCAILHDAKINHIRVNSVQLDEVCTRVRVLQRHAEHENEGDQYALTAIAKETKLILAYHVGRRNEDSAFAIMQELCDRVWGRFQLTTDGFGGYRTAAKCLLSDRVDYAQQIKTFGKPLDKFGNELRYTPRRCIGVRTKKVFGTPYDRLITTSHAERNNLNVRHFNRRFTRLTLGYSKKIMNLRFAVALFVTHHNFCRKHSALDGKTPAMAGKLTDHPWTIEELLTAGNPVSSTV